VSAMSITFFGAAGRVTGSCSLIECCGKKIIVDCGMVQGDKDANELNREEFPIAPSAVDAVVLTHGHLDHAGRLPRLVEGGFSGPVFCHGATAELAEIVWRDSARLTAKWDGGALYNDDAINRTLQLIQPLRYKKPVDLGGGLELTAYDAGHILGSSHCLFSGDGKRLLMSGDIGSPNTPIIRDPTTEWEDELDAVVIESTYGNRLHKSREDTIEEFKQIVLKAIDQRGFVLIPAFAIGRTQELLFHFNTMVTKKRLPRIPVLLDSPMAEKVTSVYRQHRECYDDQTWKLIEEGNAPMRFEGFRELVTSDESKAVKGMDPPAVIIAGSGMCTGGRILHHLKNFMDRETTTVVFVGWQGYGTLGRRMVDGEQNIKIHGQEVEVRGHVETLNGFSAHADRDALVAWSSNFKGSPKFLANHGEDDAVVGLVKALKDDGHKQVIGVEEDKTYEI
jgi:metallo-beta-lactamase family protein